MFDRYTEESRRAIFFARYEASQYGSPFIETEHLLLGLFRQDQDLARRFPGAEGLDEAPAAVLPPEVAETQKRIEATVRSMEDAIAHQDFKEARAYSDQERKERGHLRELHEKYHLADPSLPRGIRKRIEELNHSRPKVSTSADLPLSRESKSVLTFAAEEAIQLKHKRIGTEHLLLGLLREEATLAAQVLRERGVHLAQVREEFARIAPAEGRWTGFGFRRSPGPALGSPLPRFPGHTNWMPVLEGANRTTVLARHEATQRSSPSIETIDLLLAISREKDIAERLLLPVESIRKHRNMAPRPGGEKVAAEDLPFSEDSKLAFNFAAEEAAQLGQPTGLGHLLLGILRVESCAAAETLRDCGLSAAGIRALLAPPPPPSDPEQGRTYV